jgi:phosphate:Na+ symporter
MIQIVALYLAGLSFFFTGMAGISENLRQITGHRFRVLLSRATNHPIRAGLLGAAAGAVTQSTSVVAFILSGMMASGLLPLSRSLIVLACANIGTALLVFLAAVDLQLPILLLIGICGLLLAFSIFTRWKPALGCLLSIGMLFFGLEMMKQAFLPLSASHELMAVARYFDHWPDVAFLLGALLRTFIHSSSATAAIVITVNRGGILSEFPAMMTIPGLGIGTAIATSVLSVNQRGIPRQIAIYQALTNLAAAILVVVLLLIEHATGAPLLIAVLHRLSPSIGGRMAYLYLIFNITIATLAIAAVKWAPAWLAKLSPPTLEEDLSRPMYIGAQALLAPEAAHDLVEMEQMRLMRTVEGYLETARNGASPALKPLHTAAVALGEEIARFLEALLQQPISGELSARAISLQRKQETLRALEENVFLFSENMEGEGEGKLTGRLLEALDTILLTASDALKSRDAMDLEMLIGLTDDRGSTMERLRSRYGVDHAFDAHNIATLHYATTLFERNVWLLRQLALWLREDLKLAVY